MAKQQQAPAKKKKGGKKPADDADSKYTSPGSLRMQSRIRRQRRKTKRDKRQNEPSWVRSLQRKYSGEADTGYERIQRRKGAAGRKHDRDEQDANGDNFDDEGRFENREDDDDIDEDEFADVRGASGRRRGGNNNNNNDDDNVDDEEGVEVESEIDEERIERLNETQPLTRQLFVRGVPKDADDAAIHEHFSQFGEVKRIHVVQNSVTKRPSGSAFVHFVDEEGADAAYQAALRNAQEVTADVRTSDSVATDGLSHHQAKKLMYKLQKDRFTSKEPFVTMQNSRVTVMRPLDRNEAQDMTSGGKSKKEKRTVTGSEDPRNLYLLEEGVIIPGSRAAENLHPKYLESLVRDYEARKQQLRNTNLFISKTRLSVRNLPRNVSSEQLRKVFLDQVRDLLRANPALRKKKEWGKHGPIKNLRILVDRAGTSRGYGFVEFARHEFALHVLRHSNNNPTLFGANHRLVVAFAIENINALQKMERLKKLKKERIEQARMSGFVDRAGDDVDTSTPAPAGGGGSAPAADSSAADSSATGAPSAKVSAHALKMERKKQRRTERRKLAAAEAAAGGGDGDAAAAAKPKPSNVSRSGISILTTAHGVGAKAVMPVAAAAAASSASSLSAADPKPAISCCSAAICASLLALACSSDARASSSLGWMPSMASRHVRSCCLASSISFCTRCFSRPL